MSQFLQPQEMKQNRLFTRLFFSPPWQKQLVWEQDKDYNGILSMPLQLQNNAFRCKIGNNYQSSKCYCQNGYRVCWKIHQVPSVHCQVFCAKYCYSSSQFKVGISGFGNLRTMSMDKWATSKSAQLSAKVWVFCLKMP